MKENNIKILATLGPASMKKSIIENMDLSGVDIFRVNLSHTKMEDFINIIKEIRQWTQKPICIDTEGAQIRTGRMKYDQVVVENNNLVFLTSSDVLGDEFHIPLYPIVPRRDLQLGDILAIDFHSVIVQVVEIKEDNVYARVLSGGKIGSNKGVNIDKPINLQPFTEKDLKALEISKEMGLTYFALSFAAKEEDIKRLRDLFPYPIFIISKIESRAGLENLEKICQASDAILIDRGDLSREVSLAKIALAQKHILDTAKKIGTPVYVATNLLETMVDNFDPTRAEINDITSILLSGSKGLVLAAETAVGKHPIRSTRMASSIRKEVENYNRESFLNSIYDYDLIDPHGGALVQNFASYLKFEHINSLPRIRVDDRVLSDITAIAEGIYSPIKGFMNYEELMSVLEHYKLLSGTVWTLPILLQINKEEINFSKGDTVALERKEDSKLYAIIKVSDIEKIDLTQISKKWFGIDDLNHPGVFSFRKKGEYIISGEVFMVKKPSFNISSYSLTPKQTRQIFKDRGWQKVVGFHTRNVIHRGHEFIQKKALDLVNADALFISPVIGHKKANDFSAQAILKSYETMIKNNYYSPYPTLIAAFDTYSRYSGPREAVFTALTRKNFGCTHFVVGRDHTGVGSYYAPDASHKIFDKIGDIGITPLMFDAAYFCRVCNKHVDNCSHSQEQRIGLSGTEVRRCLIENRDIPGYLMRKEVKEALINMSEKVFEEGEK